MRPLELALLLGNLLALLWPLMSSGFRRRWLFLPLIVLLLGSVQVSVEGWRWQMLPIYAVTLGMVGFGLFGFWRMRSVGPARRRFAMAVAGSAFGLLLCSLGTVASYLLPVYELPVSVASHPVGHARWELAGAGQEDVVGSFWYPAAATQSDWVPSQYILEDHGSVDASLDGLSAELFGAPSWFLDHLALVQPRAGFRVRAAEGAWPLVVFLHGDGTVPELYTTLLEDLAASGCVVFAPDLPGLSTRQTAKQVDPAATREERLAAAVATLEATLVHLGAGSPSAMEKVISLEKPPVLLGHQLGAGIAAEFARRAPTQVGALMLLDPDLGPDALSEGTVRPTFVLHRDYSLRLAAAGEESASGGGVVSGVVEASLRGPGGEDLFAHPGARGYAVMIEGLASFDCSDLPLLSPLLSLYDQVGELPPDVVHRHVAGLLLAFLDEELEQGQGAVQAACDAAGPELTVSLRSFPR